MKTFTREVSLSLAWSNSIGIETPRRRRRRRSAREPPAVARLGGSDARRTSATVATTVPAKVTGRTTGRSGQSRARPSLLQAGQLRPSASLGSLVPLALQVPAGDASRAFCRRFPVLQPVGVSGSPAGGGSGARIRPAPARRRPRRNREQHRGEIGTVQQAASFRGCGQAANRRRRLATTPWRGRVSSPEPRSTTTTIAPSCRTRSRSSRPPRSLSPPRSRFRAQPLSRRSSTRSARSERPGSAGSSQRSSCWR